MTIPRLLAMNQYWEQHPPIHIMIAAYFGLGKKEEPKQTDMEDFFSTLPVVPK